MVEEIKVEWIDQSRRPTFCFTSYFWAFGVLLGATILYLVRSLEGGGDFSSGGSENMNWAEAAGGSRNSSSQAAPDTMYKHCRYDLEPPGLLFG